MNTLFAITFLALNIAVTYGQGQVVFANKVGTAVDAPVFIRGTQIGPGPAFSAQLFVLNKQAGSFTPLTPISAFRPSGTGSAAIADRYWVSQTVDVPGVAPGENATFVVGIWRTSLGSFEDAQANFDWGVSEPFTVAVGGGVLPPANLTTLRSFPFPVPEPSTVLVGLVGISGWLLYRRPGPL